MMEEFKEWLENQIEDTNESLEKNVNLKCYGVADYYNTKLIVYKDCLDTLKQLEKHQGQGVSLGELEVGKRYGIVSKDGSERGALTVVVKGCDNYGQYVWYSDTADSTIAFKSYSQEFRTVKYFQELQ